MSSRIARKRLIFFILAGIAALWSAFAFFAKDEAPETPIATVTTGTLEEVVTAQGKLEPKEYVDVGVQVSGQLKKLHVDIGSVVKRGDLLAEIDPRTYESRVQANYARIKTLKAQKAEQEANAVFARQVEARNSRLIKLNAVSQEEYQQSQSNLKVAEAGIASLSAQIEEQESTLKGDVANLSFTKIFAPIDGTIVTQESKEGQTLNANQVAPLIGRLADLDIMTVRAQVAEADVPRLKEGMDVYFTTLGAGEHRWQGKLRQILPTPELVNEVVLFNALIDVDNGDRKLMSGMSTQVFFVMGKAENVPVIPVAALGKRLPEQDSEKGEAYTVQKPGPHEAVIHVGLMNRVQAEVKDGLAPGDVVLMPETTGGGDKTKGPKFGPRL